MATDLHVAFWCNINGTRYKPGQKVTVENDDQAEMLIQDGLCRLNDDSADEDAVSGEGAGSAPAAAGGEDSGEDSGGSGGGAVPVTPDRSAPKAAWVEYAMSQGMPEGEARAASKTALIATYDPDPAPEPDPAPDPASSDS